jgi:hypothetical protein
MHHVEGNSISALYAPTTGKIISKCQKNSFFLMRHHVDRDIKEKSSSYIKRTATLIALKQT